MKEAETQALQLGCVKSERDMNMSRRHRIDPGAFKERGPIEKAPEGALFKELGIKIETGHF